MKERLRLSDHEILEKARAEGTLIINKVTNSELGGFEVFEAVNCRVMTAEFIPEKNIIRKHVDITIKLRKYL